MSRIAIAAASILLLFCGMMPGVASAATTSPAAAKSAAIKAADRWLKIVDSGKYDDSWKQASGLFKAHVTEDQWTQKVGPARQGLGALVSRKVKSAEYMTSMPGAPDGEYVVIQYRTSFEHKKSAVETVTPMLDSDGQWRVSGYYIR
jgi:Protein of unknown function (DUF4019)